MSQVTLLAAKLTEQQFDLLPIGICVIDHDHIIIKWNAVLTSWTGISTDRAVGSKLMDHYPNLLSARFLPRIQEVFKSGQPALFAPSTTHPFLPDPNQSVLLKTLISSLGGQGQFAQICLTDVTSQYSQIQDLRKEKEQHLISRDRAKAADLAKSEFLANMSHEIRTPMTAILGYADLLSDEQLVDSQRRKAINTIKRNGQHLLTIINDILDLSKIEAGKMTLEQIQTDPVRIVNEVLSLMLARAQDKGIDLVIKYDTPIPEQITSDPTKLQQILLNLLGNALKFTEMGSVTLHMAADSVRQQFQVRVVDTGIGMSAEQRDTISRFEAFHQANNSTTRQFGGSGLGLRISNSFAHLLGGEINVESVLGEGSTFTMTVSTGNLKGTRILNPELIGQRLEKTSQEEGQKLYGLAEKPLEGSRLLLAEDGPDNQRLISFILEKAGAYVTLAENGQIAVDKVHEANRSGKAFDVILMDMQMPVIDGYEATRQLRKEDYAGPIIALTAHAMAEDRQKCLNAGCDNYTTKPIDRKMLVSVIAEYTSVKYSTTPVEAPAT